MFVGFELCFLHTTLRSFIGFARSWLWLWLEGLGLSLVDILELTKL